MPTTLSSIREQIASIREKMRAPPEAPPVPEPPPEYAFSRGLQICEAPPREKIERPSLDEARQLIRDEMLAYLAEPKPEHILLIRSSPGTGKTTIAVDVAHEMAARGKRVMYAAPRHDFRNDIERACEFNEQPTSLWYEWLPRQTEGPETCIHTKAINRWMGKGYPAMDFCAGVCGWNYVKECPYHRQRERREPLIMCQHAHVPLGHPLEFSVVFGDESPMGAFEHWRTIDSADIVPKAMSPDNPIRALLLELANICNTETLIEGHELLSALHNSPKAIAQLCADFRVPLDAEGLVSQPHSVEEAERADVWYVHKLAHLLWREANIAAQGNDYPHRILAGNGKLHLLMRRQPNNRLPRHVIWMDATANARIYQALFGREVRVVKAAPRVRGRVMQIYDRANGKTALVGEEEPTEKAKQSARLIENICQDQGYDDPAVITFQDAEALFDGKSDHFYGARGKNDYKACDAVFILGAPIPHIDGLKRTASMIFHERDLPFNAHWHATNKLYSYVGDDDNGRSYPVGGYWGDEDLEAIVSVYREDEILQAAHRVRPILSEKDIWLLTNIPIDELPPTRLLSMSEVVGAPLGINIWKWMDLQEAIRGMTALTTSDIMEKTGVSKPTAYKYMELLKERGWRDYDKEKDGPLIILETGGRPPKTLVRDDL